MSITRMREKLEHVFKPVLILFAAIFFVGIFFMYNSMNFSGRNKENSASIATVNGNKLDADEFDARVSQQTADAENQRGNLSPLDQAQIKSQVLTQMIEDRIQVSAAEKQGIEVGRREIGAARDKMVDQEVARQKDMAFGITDQPGKKKKKVSDAEFRALLKSQDQTLDGLRAQIAKRLTDSVLYDQLMVQKLQAKVRGGVGNVTDTQLENAYREAKTAQIIIGGMPDAQAKQKADSVLQELKAGGDFAKLAKQYSIDPSTKNNGGVSKDYTSIFGDKDLENLKVGDMSGVIKSYEGYKIVKILDSRMPKDFDKNKKKLRDQYAMMESYRTLGDILQKAEKSAKITWQNPEYEGFYLASKAQYAAPGDRDKMMKDAVTKLEKASVSDLHNADVSCELAQIYAEQKQYTKAINILVDLMDVRRVVDHVNLRLMLSQLYIMNKQNDKAVAELKEIAENNANPQIHQYVQMMYKQAGRADLSDAEGKWIKEHQAMMAPTPSATAQPAPTPESKSSAKPTK